jgi:lipoprotein|nr:MAG TPA: protein of unknown function (DUF4969) [Caudoviricetes sp.]
MKKSTVLVIMAVISVSAAILGCSNSKANSSNYSNPVIYEDKDIKVYRIDNGSRCSVTVAFSKKSGDIDACY